jgi:anti-sigma B factor antagonist
MTGTGDYEVRLTGADGGEAVVHLVGEIDMTARQDLEATLAQATGHPRMVVDLSRTTFIDSTGLKALVAAWRTQTDAGREMVLRDPSPEVVRTIEFAGLGGTFPIEVSDGSEH